MKLIPATGARLLSIGDFSLTCSWLGLLQGSALECAALTLSRSDAHLVASEPAKWAEDHKGTTPRVMKGVMAEVHKSMEELEQMERQMKERWAEGMKNRYPTDRFVKSF